MALSLYDVTIPVMIRNLGILAKLLERGEAFAAQTGLSPASLLQARLVEDMLPLIGQVQRASDTAKFVAVRVGGLANVAMADEEASFADLLARLAATIGVLRTVPTDAFDGQENAPVILSGSSGSHTFTGRSYVLDFALPNFFFHVTTAYAVLRHKGVPIGKGDYLGWR